MTPLRKLRQDCTVPTIFQKSKQETTVKKILTPDELLKHMVNTNEINCKERLRMIASCLNGKKSFLSIYMENPKPYFGVTFDISYFHSRLGSIAHFKMRI